MIDFTSSLYLGFEHASRSLPSWERLTLGKPAALETVPGTLQVQRELAALTGCEAVMLGSSTLHLFCDLFAILAKGKVEIWIDEATYPIARWGTDRAAALGVPVRTFPHHNAAALRKALGSRRVARLVIVTDGYSPLNGTHAPLAEYSECARARDGLLIVDDTQSLGVFGSRNESPLPYGSGGGGSLMHCDIHNPAVVVVSSLAKAFGVPLAMAGGSKQFVEIFRRNSATLEHCSPPSAAATVSAQQALDLNLRFGDALRTRLAELVVRFRCGLREFVAAKSLFPVQPLNLPAQINVRALYRNLLRLGVRTVLHRDQTDSNSRVSFVLTARHSPSEIDHAVQGVRDFIRAYSRRGPTDCWQLSMA